MKTLIQKIKCKLGFHTFFNGIWIHKYCRHCLKKELRDDYKLHERTKVKDLK